MTPCKKCGFPSEPCLNCGLFGKAPEIDIYLEKPYYIITVSNKGELSLRNYTTVKLAEKEFDENTKGYILVETFSQVVAVFDKNITIPTNPICVYL